LKIRSALSEETVTATDWPMVHHYVEYIGATSEHIGEHITLLWKYHCPMESYSLS
jgi:hypothetical protein